MDNIYNGKPIDIFYTGYLNKDISFGDINYFEPKNIQHKKLVNGIIDRLKISYIYIYIMEVGDKLNLERFYRQGFALKGI